MKKPHNTEPSKKLLLQNRITKMIQDLVKIDGVKNHPTTAEGILKFLPLLNPPIVMRDTSALPYYSETTNSKRNSKLYCIMSILSVMFQKWIHLYQEQPKDRRLYGIRKVEQDCIWLERIIEHGLDRYTVAGDAATGYYLKLLCRTLKKS